MAIMMCGTPGSGKSYSAMALCVVPALDAGRPVRTNIPLELDAIRARWPEADVGQVDPREPGVWQSIPGGALVVLDEVGSLWPSGQRAGEGGPAVDWLAMHRHRVGDVRGRSVSTDVVLISQGSTDLAGWARSKVDRTYILRKLDVVGASRRYRCDWYQGWQDSRKPSARLHIGGGTGEYLLDVCKLYRSHTKVDDGVQAVAVAELRPDGRKTVWSSFGMRAAGLGLLVVVAAVVYVRDQGGNFFVSKSDSSKTQTVEGSEVRSKVPARPAASADPAGGEPASPPRGEALVDPSSWRLSAWIGPRHDGTFAVIATSGKDQRRLESSRCETRQAGEWGCWVDGKFATGATGSGLNLVDVVDPEGTAEVQTDYVAVAKRRMDAGIPVGDHRSLLELGKGR